jgi:transposase
LTGITSEANRFLKNWSYFDLQTKIEYKAKEQGIKVIYIKPRYTSRRCSKCGYIHSDNRPTQARFICQQCGYEENADYNASINIR